VETTKGILNRKEPPLIKDAVELDLKLKPYEKHVLNNGAEVYVIDAGAEDVLQLEWVFYSGNWFENKNLVAASTNFLLKNGTSKKMPFNSMSTLNIMVLI
jgi:zinc protease